MARTTLPSGITIEYDSMGDPGAPALLWIMGFTAQMISWPEDFLRLFLDEGFRVVRFDNRDCGLSTKLDGVSVDTAAVTAAAMMGTEMPQVPYTLSDMADDAVGVLDALGIDKAHVIGASMGGMIAQTVALEHPGRTLSLTSIMSNTGDLSHGRPTDAALAALLAPPAPDREGVIDQAASWAIWCSRRYFSLDEARARAAREYDRSFYPEGAPRQLAAIYASGDRTERLRALDVPTLVIHGRDDTLITPGGGERTAEVIPGAVLLMVNDMGHDVPTPLWPVIRDSISTHARRAGN